MYCGNCGAREVPGALFCGKCGARVANQGVVMPVDAAAPSAESRVEHEAHDHAPAAGTPDPAHVPIPTEDLDIQPTPADPSTTSSAARQHKNRRLLGSVAVLAALTVAAVIAFHTITVTLLAAHGSIADLLPADTAVFAEVNLDPAGSQGDHWQAIEKTFQNQPGWTTVQQSIDRELALPIGNTFDSSSGEATWQDLITVSNGQFAVAVTDPAALATSGEGYGQDRSQDSVVLIAGLKVRGTLSDIIAKYGFGTPIKAATANGVDIYQVGAGQFSTGQAFAAILNGYAVIGATEDAVSREVSVWKGQAPRLSDNPNYKAVMKQVSDGGPAFAYIDEPALIAAIDQANQQDPANREAINELSLLQANSGQVGIALTAQSDGLELRTATLAASAGTTTTTTTPDKAADALPADTLAYLSLDNVTSLYNTTIGKMLQSGTLSEDSYNQTQSQVGDLISLLDGEVAIGLLPLNVNALQNFNLDQYNGGYNTTSLPLVGLIDVSEHPTALSTVRAWLDRTFYQYGEGNAFYTTTTPQGNPLYVWPGGWGYALIKNWLVVSPSIQIVANAEEGVLAGGQQNLTSADPTVAQQQSTGDSATDIMVRLQSIYQMLEQQQSTMSYDVQQQYQNWRPWLAPLQSLAITTGTEAGGTISTLDAVLKITNGS